jgi:hypothetical protein
MNLREERESARSGLWLPHKRADGTGKEWGKVSHGCLALDEARHGAFIRKDEVVQYKYSTGEGKLKEKEINNKLE